MATDKIPHRERRPSMGAPIVDIQGSVGPAGISRPKHKRTLTGFGAGEIKAVEGECFICNSFFQLPFLIGIDLFPSGRLVMMEGKLQGAPH
jgi:hypothetical protein